MLFLNVRSASRNDLLRNTIEELTWWVGMESCRSLSHFTSLGSMPRCQLRPHLQTSVKDFHPVSPSLGASTNYTVSAVKVLTGVPRFQKWVISRQEKATLPFLILYVGLSLRSRHQLQKRLVGWNFCKRKKWRKSKEASRGFWQCRSDSLEGQMEGKIARQSLRLQDNSKDLSVKLIRSLQAKIA